MAKTETPADEKPALTKAEAAKQIGIPESAVFDFRDHGAFVQVVTVDSWKLKSTDKEGVAAWKARQKPAQADKAE